MTSVDEKTCTARMKGMEAAVNILIGSHALLFSAVVGLVVVILKH